MATANITLDLPNSLLALPQGSIMELLTMGYALGIALVGVLAYFGIKGTNEAIDFQNSKRLEKSFNRGKQLEFQFKE